MFLDILEQKKKKKLNFIFKIGSKISGKMALHVYKMTLKKSVISSFFLSFLVFVLKKKKYLMTN